MSNFLILFTSPVGEIFVQYVEECRNKDRLHVLVVHVRHVIEDTDLVTFQEIDGDLLASFLIFISNHAHYCEEAFLLLIIHEISLLQ